MSRFNRMFELYKEKKISRRLLYGCIKTRTRKQINSHFFKIKYYLDKKFKNLDNTNMTRKENFLQEIGSLTPPQTTKETSMFFYDEITQKNMEIPLSILEKIITIQKYNKDNKGRIKMPMIIDENILRTIAEEKLFYDIIKKKVEEDKL